VFKCKVCGGELEDRVSLMNHYHITYPHQERGEEGRGTNVGGGIRFR